MSRPPRVWLFDLDNTLHNASAASLPEITEQMALYMVRELGLSRSECDALRRRYWQRYGATLLGLVRHHAVKAAHFLHDTHRLPGLESRVHGHPHDVAVLRALPGRKVVLTNAPRHYAMRVLGALGIAGWFDDVIAVEDMAMFGALRPKPDARMLRRVAARLRVPPSRCVLVEDTLEHQKAAHRLGMKTVWLQRWLRRLPSGVRRGWRPVYVDRRVHGLAALRRNPP
jgi:putative hydrolase of the HAD superfamily